MGGSSSTNTASSGASSGNGLASFQGGSASPNYNKESFSNLLGADAASVYSQGPKVNQELQYGGLSGQTTGALNNLYGAATANAGGINAANAANTALIGADPNAANPYFEENLQQTLQDAGTGVNAALGANGRYGSNVHVNQLGQTLGGLSNQARQGQYQYQQGRIDNAVNNAGGLYQQSLQPYQTQLGVGQAFDADRQAAITARDSLFSRNANSAYDQLARFQQLQNGTAQQTTTRQPGLLDYLGAGAGIASALL